MATLKSRLAKSKGTEQADEKPAAGFFDGFESSGSSTTGIDQRKWREDEGTINYDPSLELQQTIERADVIGRAQAARQADVACVAGNPVQPTSRERIEHAMRPRSGVRDDGLYELSTHRTARGEGRTSAANRAAKRERQEARAWSMFAWIVSLGAGRT